MQHTLKFKMGAAVASLLAICSVVIGQGKVTHPQKTVVENYKPEGKSMKPPSGPSFYISPVDGSKGMFSVLLGDGAGKTIAGSFSTQQIEIFEAVLDAAKAFALSDEKVGSTNPITTRLMDQHEWSLFVDVSKQGKSSRLYVSLVTPQGKVTAEAGEINRDEKKEPSGLMLDMLMQVREAKSVASKNPL
jgi:hypothetical protein